MKAIVIPANNVHDILTGLRKEDFRIWNPNYKGRILVCSSTNKFKGYTCGYALCTADLGKVIEYPGEAQDGGPLYEWQLKKVRFIEPFPVKARNRQSFFEVDDTKVRELKGLKLQEWFEHFYDPLRSW